MLCKVIFRAALCLLLLSIGACSAPDSGTSEGVVEAGEAESAKAGEVETAEAEGEKVSSEASEVIISLGNKKFTVQQVKWMQPNVSDREIVKIANWWLENELLYAEALKRGVDKQPKAKFIAEVMSKSAVSRELRTQVQDAVKISDEEARAYYEENKETDQSLKQPGYLNFSHVKCRTVEEAQSVLGRIKAGEDVSTLARELSFHRDAQRGGVARKYTYTRVKRSFGTKFFDALVAAKDGELVGPIKVEGGYEAARQEGKTGPRLLTFEEAKGKINAKMRYRERNKALTSLMNSLRKAAADKIVKSSRILEAEKSIKSGPTPPTGRLRGGSTQK